MFVVGWNMPGYLPEMTPMECVSWDDAKALLLDELSFAQDTVSDMDSDEGWDEVESLQDLMDDLQESDGDVWDGTAGRFAYWIQESD